MSRMTRRSFLAGSAVAATALPVSRFGLAAVPGMNLRAAPATVSLLGAAGPRTEVWAYEGRIPGPILRVPRRAPLTIDLLNDLTDPTTVHWHGLRLPNAMDGVAHVTQPPVMPGERFHYAFTPPDAGTFWYHPHIMTSEQLGRGLGGVLVVEEETPPKVDRDLVWVIDDWRMARDGSIVGDFDNMHDASHAGRFGNTVTLNGALAESFRVRPGERLRLRLVNVANARHFSLDFGSLKPAVIALDGQPVAPFRPNSGSIWLAPSQRVDVILDIEGEAGDRIDIIDRYYQRQAYRFLTLDVAGKRLRSGTREIQALPSNDLPVPNLEKASRHQLLLGGGAMDPAYRRGEIDRDTLVKRMRAGAIWTLNGQAMLKTEGHHQRLFNFGLGEHVRMEIVNDTVFDHPIHLHGHHFQVISRNGRAMNTVIWRDTILLRPSERSEIAFVADNPGDWMLHCHVLSHQARGMMGTIRVA